MDCVSQDAVCELANWVSENELIGPWLAEIVGHSSNFDRDYGQAFIGLVGVSFGFWRWWRYREHILHKRLAEYLRENDERLAGCTAQLLEAIQRPGPGQRPNDPLFVNQDLRAVLRERNWDNEVLALSVETSADWFDRRRATLKTRECAEARSPGVQVDGRPTAA